MISNKSQILDNNKLLCEQLFNGLNGEVYICDEDYNIIFANKTLKNRLNKDASKLKCYQYIYENDTVCQYCKLKESIETKTSIINEIYNKINNKWYKTTFLSITQTDNSHLFMIILEDITNYKLAVMKENEIELKFQTISDTTLDSIIIIDSNNLIKHWNKSAEKLFGYTKEEILNKSLHQLLAPTRFHARAKEGLKYFKHSGEGNAIGQTLELSAFKKNREEIVIELAVSSLFLNNEWHAIGIIRDITDKKRTAKLLEETIKIISEKNIMLQEKDHELTAQFEELQSKEQTLLQQNIELEMSKKSITKAFSQIEQTNLQLEESNKHKDKFLATMSHELRTPLNAIIGFTDIIHKQYFGTINEKQLEYINYVKESSSHLLTLINNILNIAQINSDTTTYTPSVVCINSIIKDILSLMKPQFNYKEITITTLLDPNVPKIFADKEKIKQCLLNLLRNAHQFTPKGGNITVESILLDNIIKISITDNGIGIQDQEKDKIFINFYQIDRYKNGNIKGVGVGLPLTKKFIELHNGEIGFNSEYNKGSTFWFTLPLKPENSNDSATSNINNEIQEN